MPRHLGIVALLIAVSACGSATPDEGLVEVDTDTDETSPAPEDRDLLSAVRQSGERSANETRYRGRAEVTTTGTGTCSEASSMSYEVDTEAHTMRLDVDGVGTGDDLRLVDGSVYISAAVLWPDAAPDRWFAVEEFPVLRSAVNAALSTDLDRIEENLSFGSSPGDMLERFDRYTATTSKAGERTVRDVPTTGILTTFTAEAAFTDSGLDEPVDPSEIETAQAWYDEHSPPTMTVWISDDGLVRRIDLDWPIPFTAPSGAGGTDVIEFEGWYEFWDYDGEVIVDAPIDSDLMTTADVESLGSPTAVAEPTGCR